MRDAVVAGHFDSKAASWDADAGKHELAADIVRVVTRETVHHIEKPRRAGPQRYPVFFPTGRMRIFGAPDLAGEVNDPESQDLMIGRITLHQKTAWMLKSFLK